MTNIAELYLQLLTPDNNVVAQVTASILEKYQNENSIYQILEILKTNSNSFIRRQAAIGLKTILHNFWYGYSAEPSAEGIINEIIASLTNESDPLIRHLIIYALEPICSYREVEWPQLIDNLALDCIQSDDQEVLDVGLSLFEMIIPYLDEGTIDEILQPLSEKIELVFQTETELISTSSKLISSLANIFDPPLPECLEALITALFSIFKDLLLSEYPLIHKIANNLSDIVSNESVTSSSDHLVYLLEIANDESISPEVIYHVFTPISTIIKNKFTEPTIYQHVPDLLTTAFKCASLSFKDDCITEQSDSLYIFNTVDSIPKYEEEDGSSLFELFSDIISDSSVQESFSSLLVFQFFIDNYPHIIAENLKQTVTFLLQQSDTSNHHCLCEQSMICLYHLIDVINAGLIQYSNEILEAIINAISSDHDQLIIDGLTALTELFHKVGFHHSLIPAILELLIELIRKSQEIMNGCFLALNALIFASGTDIGPYCDQLAPIFLEMIQTTENLYPIARSNASESIAQLMKNAPIEMQEFSNDSMQILIGQCSSSEDLSELSDVLSAFSIIINCDVPHLQEAIGSAIEKSIFILQLDFPFLGNSNNKEDENDDDDDENAENDEDEFEDSLPIEYEAKKIALNFISLLVVANPEIVSSSVDDYVELIIRHIVDCYEPETRAAAIKALASFSIANLMDPTSLVKEFLEIELLLDDYALIVKQCFNSTRKILTPEIPPKLVNIFVQMAIRGISIDSDKRLQCQQAEDADNDDFDNYEIEHSILKFLSKVALTHTEIFPVDLLFEIYENRADRDDSNEFMSLAVVPFTNYLIALKKQGIQESPKIEEIFHLIFSSLSICDGTVAPFPLFAVKELFKEGVFQLDSNFLEPTFQTVNEICQLENDGQPSFNETMAAAASLLFILFALMDDQFDVETYLKFMISTLPITFKRYSHDAYSSLILLFQKHAQLFEQLTPDVITVLAQTLALPDNSLELAGFSSDDIGQLIEFFKVLTQNAPNSNQIVEEALSDQIELDRLTQRIS